MAELEKTEEKQKPKLREKLKKNRQAIALWTAVLTALGSTGIPKIVELLENKPDVEDVQKMIAQQTESLTEATNRLMDASSGMVERVHEVELSVAKLQGIVLALGQHSRRPKIKEAVKEMRIEESVPPLAPVVKPSTPESDTDSVKPDKPVTLTPPNELFKKVPKFDAQKQLQIQEPTE